jgi:hypothetical protein
VKRAIVKQTLSGLFLLALFIVMGCAQENVAGVETAVPSPTNTATAVAIDTAVPDASPTPTFATATLPEPNSEIQCTPTPHPEGGAALPEPTLTVADRIALSDMVLLGRITEVRVDAVNGTSVVVQVEQYFKSMGSDVVAIGGFGAGSLCGRMVQIGDRFIFYVQQYAVGSTTYQHLMSFEYGMTDQAIAWPTPERVAEIERVVAGLNE